MGYAHGWRANPAVEYQIIANHQIHPGSDSNPGIPNRPRRTLIWSIAPCGWPICPASMFRPGSPGVWPTRIWSACLGDRRCSTTLYSTSVFLICWEKSLEITWNCWITCLFLYWTDFCVGDVAIFSHWFSTFWLSSGFVIEATEDPFFGTMPCKIGISLDR